MRITKNQLRQIIKEELSAVISEASAEEDTSGNTDHPGKSCDEAHPDMSHEDFMEEEGPSGEAASSRKRSMRSRHSGSSIGMRGITRESLKKKRAMKAKKGKTK
tara:strand:+ start:49 stop:360 length:312 start_codon:yes stop_codon:yes gene_type:complete